ncbi:MAG: glycosyltransferase [Candidatus Omnitrophica bacterium]|nr:glycosyltransferase [Candidatus Omnitrophota bacterium]
MNKKIKIMHITHSLDVGGLEQLVLNLSRQMDSSKFDVNVCALTEQVGLADEFEKAGVEVFTRPKRAGIDWRLCDKLKKLFIEQNIDIVHSHNVGAWIYASVAALLARKKTIHTEHSNVFRDQPKRIMIEKMLSWFTDKIICDSNKVRDFLIDKQGIAANKTQVIFNGIDLDYYGQTHDLNKIKEKLNINDADFVIGCVARLAPVKGHDSMLTAFCKVCAQAKNIKLLLVGDGELIEELKVLAERLRISSRVIFTGERRDIPQLLGVMNAFILTSMSEGFPLSILEAMAAKLPIIATRVGGVPEVVGHNQTGLICEKGNIEEISEAILFMANNQSDAAKMGARGYQRVKNNYNVENMKDEYEEVYSGVMGMPIEKKERRPKILVLTNVFPCEDMPNVGHYIRNQIQELRYYSDIRIVMGLPHDIMKARGEIQLSQGTIWDNVKLFVTQYATLKKIGVLFSGQSYIHATKKIVAGIYRDFPFDMIISYWTYPEGLAANYYGRKYNVPVLLRPRGSDINIFAKYKLLKNKIVNVLKRSDKIIPVSEHLMRSIQDLGVPDEKVAFIRNAVEHDKFHPLEKYICRQALSLDPDEKMILYIGNLYPVKGIEYLMDALKIMDERNERAHVYIIGNGHLLPLVEKTMKALRHVKLHPVGTVEHKDLNVWINAADVLCLPSIHEGCPNVVLEALTCGTPVVATNVGGIPELITCDDLGIMVPEKDAEELAKALRASLEKDWDKKAIAGSMKTETWENVGKKLDEVCRALIASYTC